MSLSRREVMKVGGLGLLGLGGAAGLGGAPIFTDVSAREASSLSSGDFPAPFDSVFVRPPILRPTHWEYDEAGKLVRQTYTLTQREATARILPRLTTQMWGYNGIVPGPTIKVAQGVETVLRVRNQLPAKHPLFGHDFATSVHLHGSASLPQYDGYANDITPPGFYKDYHYPNHQHARTIWYHDHAVHYTAHNAYTGLAAQYHIHDPLERELLPQGQFDVPLTVGDAMFAEDGQLAYDDESQSGLYGDVILVNGRAWPTMRVQKRVYRFRVLVTSISRSYRFRLSTGDEVYMVATDGGLMPQSQAVTQWRQGSAERYEVLIDFRKYRAGQRVVLENLSNDNNRDYDHTNKVMAFDVMDDAAGDGVVDRSDPTWDRIPTTLMSTEVMGLTAASAIKTRHLAMERKHGMWTINGSTWHDVAASEFQKVMADPDLGDIELWEIENRSGGWFHPTHIHLIDFRILDRNGRPPETYEQGPKDVVYVGENETVRVVARFGDPEHPEAHGRYMVHCHNLVHEDHDMMNQFAVGWKPGEPDDCDPIKADPCKYDDQVFIDGVAPGQPEAPEAEVDRGVVELDWDRPDDEGGDDVTGYRVRGFSGGALAVSVLAADEKHEFTDLPPGVAYTFTVAALNRLGEGEQSAHSAPVTLGAPVALPGRPSIASAAAVKTGVVVKWSAPRNAAAAGVTGYQLRVIRVSTGKRVGPVRNVGAGARSLRINGLDSSTPHTVQVRAISAAGAGLYSRRSRRFTPRPADSTPPRVVARSPRPNARGVRRTSNVTVLVSEAVAGVSARTVTLRPASGGGAVRAKVSYNRRAQRIVVNPARRLAPNTRYTVRLTRGVRDAAGNPMKPVTWSFTTGRGL